MNKLVCVFTPFQKKKCRHEQQQIAEKQGQSPTISSVLQDFLKNAQQWRTRYNRMALTYVVSLFTNWISDEASYLTVIFFIVSDVQEPYAIVILLQNDLALIDLQTSSFPTFENPYPMDVHESPVTCCSYIADCPSDIIPAFYSVGRATQKRSGFSDKEWPISGGEWSPTSCSYNEIIITG